MFIFCPGSLSLVRFRGIILLDVWEVIDSVVQPSKRSRKLRQNVLVRVMKNLDNYEEEQVGIGNLVPNKETFMKNHVSEGLAGKRERGEGEKEEEGYSTIATVVVLKCTLEMSNMFGEGLSQELLHFNIALRFLGVKLRLDISHHEIEDSF